MTRSQITVVGGGIAGLTLAAALDPDRFEVTVIEAEPGRAATGGALALWPSAVRALRQLGVGRLVDEHRISEVVGAIRDLRTGRPLLPTAPVNLTMVPRPALLAALAGCLPAGVRREHAVVVDPRSLPGQVVVGADGVRSTVRGLVSTRGRDTLVGSDRAGERVATPYLALRGLTDGQRGVDVDMDVNDVDMDIVGEYWGHGRLFGLVPLRQGTYWFSTHRSTLGPEPLDPAVALAEVRATFAGSAPGVEATLAAADPGEVVATRIWVAPAMRRYVNGRYVVIGDAAHAMTPNLGRGACDAIVDAYTLAQALGRPGGLARWQARRLPFTQAVRLSSSALMRVALSGRPAQLASLVRRTGGG